MKNFVGLFAISVALAVSLYLEVHAVRASAPYCPLSDGCDAVQSSPLATSLPFRLSALGVGFFASVLCGLYMFGVGGSLRLAKALRWLLALGLIASLGLTAYSVVVVGATCIWCLVVLACLLVTNALGVPNTRAKAVESGPRGWRDLLILIPLLVAIWGGFSISNGSGEIVLDQQSFQKLASFPKIGGAPAEKGIVADFACIHCRQELAALAQSGDPFYLVPVVTQKAHSREMLELFVSARRQGLDVRFCKRLPAMDMGAEWVKYASEELRPSSADVRSAEALRKGSNHFVSRHPLQGVPARIVQASR